MPSGSKDLRCVPVDGGPLAAICDPAELAANLTTLGENEFAKKVAVLFANEEAVAADVSGDRIRFMGSDVIVFSGDYYRFIGADHVVLYTEPVPIARLKAAAANGGIIGIALSDNIPEFHSLFKAQGLTEAQISVAETWDCYNGHWDGIKQFPPPYYWPLKYLGLHVYSVEDYQLNYYEALYRPPAPLKISSFSQEELAQVNIISFPGVRFAETAALQPAAMMECHCWGQEWAGVDGSLHGNSSPWHSTSL